MISDESSLIHVMPLHKDKEQELFGGRMWAAYIVALVGPGNIAVVQGTIMAAKSYNLWETVNQSKSTKSGSSCLADDADLYV